MKRVLYTIMVMAIMTSTVCCNTAQKTQITTEYVAQETGIENDVAADLAVEGKNTVIEEDTLRIKENQPEDAGEDTKTDMGIGVYIKESSDLLGTESKALVEETPLQPPVFGLVDAHADTITRTLLPQYDANLYSNSLHVDFKRLQEYGAPVQVFALWCADKYVPNAFEYTKSLIDFFEAALEEHNDIIELATSLADMVRNAGNNKISAILSIEGGEALMGDINNLDYFYNRGVRIMGLTWNRENELGYGQATSSKEGLKPFGIEVVKRIEELGMIMDISHINEAGFWDAHNISTRPYMASHSNAYAITPHNRNLRDELIAAMVDRGGIIGLALYPEFLSQNSKPTIDDIMAHIRHFTELDAVSILGFGSDFDGFNTMPEGITDISSMKNLGGFIADNFGEDISAGIMWENFYDFFVRFYNGT